MPAAGVYFVLPSRMAAMPASEMLSGVMKSGSPVPKPMTSRPSAFICLASESIAKVVEGLTFSAIFESSFIAYLPYAVDFLPIHYIAISAVLQPKYSA